MNDAAWGVSEKSLRTRSACDAIEQLTGTFYQTASTLKLTILGSGYNMIYRMCLAECPDTDMVMRVACPNLSQFPDEKTIGEVFTMKVMRENTIIPVLMVHHFGISSSNGIGPFMMMPHIDNIGNISAALKDPHLKPGEYHVLDPKIDEEKLEYLYGQMCDFLLQLSQLRFSSIGSLGPDRENLESYGRPISMNMNNMVRLANIPRSLLPARNKVYDTADEWYIALSEMHMAQLIFQPNDLVFNADDCRNKYVARQIFRRLAKTGKLSIFEFPEDGWSLQSRGQCSEKLASCPNGLNEPFRIWCDDLRAGNVLLNEDHSVAAVIDWEFAHVGPGQFSLDPPWWLLLEQPQRWSHGIEDWRNIYEPRLKTWLRAMEKVEERVETNISLTSARLSTHMRQSWETGRFWLNYAARKSWAFDGIYWKFLDERFSAPEKVACLARISGDQGLHF